ncbi:hypothetical protein [Streptomyces roseochromogenus]|uniref:Uncharacterized protein n=1 Tax=Streptomyces roseochromogenus subsp. oscitans DS 12.976 TaxID=1352936 RepID=V6K458_STRRC|nr:hypothetical protein [Streptomyces roseochromogenus]EST26922.1 hypothetical protein M878_26330 [Streptomyces roseochromogenus subsp. oscitans DS 12.976]
MRPILTALLRRSGLAVRAWLRGSRPVMLRVPFAYPVRSSAEDDV